MTRDRVVSLEPEVGVRQTLNARTELAAACSRVDQLRSSGRYSEAFDLAQQTLSEAEQSLDLDAMDLVPLLNQQGVIGKYNGDFVNAQRAYDRALKIAEACENSVDRSVVATLLHNLAGLAHARHDTAKAESLSRRGIEVRASTDPDRMALAADNAALAAILIDARKFGEAGQILARVVADYEQTYGPNHYEVAVSLHNLASLYARAGETQRALAPLVRALSIKERELGDSHPELAITLHNLATVQMELGERHKAANNLERAIRILGGTVQSDHPTLVACVARIQKLRTATTDL